MILFIFEGKKDEPQLFKTLQELFHFEFKEEEIQRGQNDENKRGYKHNLALKAVALESEFMSFRVTPYKKTDTADNDEKHHDRIKINVIAVRGEG